MDEVTAVAALADATRRRVYEAVVSGRGPVGRDEVARELGIGRTLAAFHLDRLAEAGLLTVSFGRLGTGTPGPGSGRPSKLYARSEAQVTVSLPPRSYVDAAELLAEALERAGADQVLQRVARSRGREHKGADMWESLRERGYEPQRDSNGTIRLRNCPFHVLAQEFPPLVCGMNLALLEGLVEDWPVNAVMRPQVGQCCVALEEKR